MAWMTCPHCGFTQIPAAKCLKCKKSLDRPRDGEAPAPAGPANPPTPSGLAGIPRVYLLGFAALALAIITGVLVWGSRTSVSTDLGPPPTSTTPEPWSLDLTGRWQGKVTTTIISAMDGGLVGGSIGNGLSETEKRSALEAEYKALEYTTSGQKVAWKGEQASHYGEVVPGQPYRVGSQDCRQYTQTVFAGGAGVTARGTACRNADGSWTPLT